MMANGGIYWRENMANVKAMSILLVNIQYPSMKILTNVGVM